MSLRSKYTEHQICKLEKKEFMKEASFDDIFIDYGHDLNTLILCRESTAHEDQQKALNDQVERSKPNKYKIKKYNKEYSDSLQDDSNFNIIKTFVISLDECKKFCETLAHRQFRASYWNQITVKIAVK